MPSKEIISKKETEEDILELILLGILCKRKLNPKLIIDYEIAKCITPDNSEELTLGEPMDLSSLGYVVNYIENLERFNKEDLYDAYLAGKLSNLTFQQFYDDRAQ